MTIISSLVSQISDFINNGPFIAVFVFLTVVVFCRAQGTYWLGRYMNHFVMTRGRPHNGWRLRAYEWIHSDSTNRAITVLHHRGWPIITLCFLTVGFQTVINLGAGVIGWPWLKYTAAMLPGSLMWATIYSTIGWSVFSAVVATAAGSPSGIAVIVTIIVLTVGFIAFRSKRTKAMLAIENKDIHTNFQG